MACCLYPTAAFVLPKDLSDGRAALVAGTLMCFCGRSVQLLETADFFLKISEEEALMHGPSVDPTKIAALLLDHLSGTAALDFLNAASKSGAITPTEGKALSGIVSLAAPGEGSEGAPSVDNRTLLTFAAMIEAWRAQGTP